MRSSYLYLITSLPSLVKQCELTLPALFLGLSVSVLMSSEVQACSCTFRKETGFLHGGHLPSNARGVLYNAMNMGEGGRLAGQILNTKPPKLDADSFSIIDVTTSRRLKAKVEAVKLHIPPLRSENTGFYRIVDKSLRACFDDANPRASSPECKDFMMQRMDNETLDKLVDEGKAENITEAVDAANGLFRIGPENGFEEGKKYLIKYLRTTNAYDHSLYGNEVSVTIDGPLRMSAADVFNIEADGDSVMSSISVPASGICSEDYAAKIQFLNYALPAAYEPYRKSMLFFTEQHHSQFSKFKKDSNNEPEYEAIFRRSDICSQLKLGDSETGRGRERVLSRCAMNTVTETKIKLRGYVGFLEVENDFHKTPVTDITITKNKDDMCHGVDFFQGVVERENEKEIRREMSSISNHTLDKEDVSRTLAVLLNLSSSKQERIRTGSVHAIASFSKYIDKLNKDEIQKILTTLLGKRAPKARAGGYYSDDLVTFITNVDLAIRQGKVGPGLREELFRPLVPYFLTDLSEKNSRGQATASQILTILGPEMQDILPGILARVDHISADILFPMLVAIAPDDERVINIVLDKIDDEHDGYYAQASFYKIKLSKKISKATLFRIVEKTFASDLAQKTAVDLAERKVDDQRLLALLVKNIRIGLADHILGNMGGRAKSAAFAILPFFEEPMNMSSYHFYSTLLVKITAPTNIKLKAQTLAIKNQPEEIATLARQAIKDLDKKGEVQYGKSSAT